MYKPKYFIAQELVPKSVFLKRGARSLELIDERLLITIDQLREKFGPCTINNWHSGGGFTESGLRTPDCKHYSPFSQHTFGRAADCKFSKATPEEVRHYILTHPEEFPFITFVELDTPTWVHIDVRNCKAITTWSPKK
ncbi:D-Ala-D-Ala carboxypeptidase family metallohydrolase [Alteromonas mediterranea]|uniref:Uncharacterized protein n=1 Tax=Alteromonas mediterranea (strain DSM 17117 / CIP 110805 / LMG 28347 / Deep ecotype) TaxID=1774373 RepID=F2GC81_ALTMD|nr:D-Ala-D-Ala carboxypeptidase family metallohydrolase [Alteromonas mediterranea]AEA99037.1 hypothetical protein MADE_1014515 [Alteromonas mediterranea DE]